MADDASIDDVERRRPMTRGGGTIPAPSRPLLALAFTAEGIATVESIVL